MVIIEKLFTKTDVNHYRQALQQVPWKAGKHTAKGMSAEVKQNSQADSNHQHVNALAKGILAKLGNHPKFVAAAIPHKIFPPHFNRYSQNDNYGFHVDAAIMRPPNSQSVMRSDLSMTLFLSDPEEYQGGELIILTDFGEQSIKLAAGDAVIYPSSSLHKVNPVTQGQRISAICWVQSLIADANLRDTLFELDQTIQGLSKGDQATREQLDSLYRVYHNLIRQNAQL